MNNMKIIFQYDGTNYYKSFQRQNGKPTVQAAIEKIFVQNTKRKNKFNFSRAY